MACLIVEKHVWETGGGGYQLQIPLEPAEQFFGPGANPTNISVRINVVRGAAQAYTCSVSRIYRNGTRRINGLPFLGRLGPCFIFFQETERNHVYDLSWDVDMAIIAARFDGWQQGRNSQYGRGRLVNIIDAPVPRHIDRI
jgi:hypothetical protein